MCKQGIKVSVPGKNKAFCFGRCFYRSPELEGNVEIQGILSAALDLLEVDPLEGVRLSKGLDPLRYGPSADVSLPHTLGRLDNEA